VEEDDPEDHLADNFYAQIQGSSVDVGGSLNI